MYTRFPLWPTHLIAAKQAWSAIVKPFDQVIDATCGNGNDTLTIAELVPEGKVWAFDVQAQAIQNTYTKLQLKEYNSRVELHQRNHIDFPPNIFPESVALIVYNLGYLPGGDKTVTTVTETTLKSIHNAMPLIKPGGMISLTLYPGHDEGLKERQALLEWAETLPPSLWLVNHLQWINRENAPSLLLMIKGLRN